jgi:hypothetical protein
MTDGSGPIRLGPALSHSRALSSAGRIPEGASKVPGSLGVVVRAFPTGSLSSGNGQPSESDVIDDHIRLHQHQIVAIAALASASHPGM